jgi:uncharacterized protein
VRAVAGSRGGTLTRDRSVAWRKDDPFGVELAVDRLSAVGVAFGTDPVPYRLDYSLETGAGFVTTRLTVTAAGEGWVRQLELQRSDAGAWSSETTSEGATDLPAAGGDVASFAGALDPDLGLSPLFNTMPVPRHGIHRRACAHDRRTIQARRTPRDF